MHFIIHHPGKAGEVFLGLPMAKLLKTHYPNCKITWVVLDLYRESVGNYPYIDKVETFPSYSCKNLADVNMHMSKHRHYVLRLKQSIEDPRGIHIDGYYSYIIDRSDPYRFMLVRDPFYIQIFRNAAAFCPGADEVDSWMPPEWFPTERAIRDGQEFEKQYGGGQVVIFSPYVADKSAPEDNASNFDMKWIYEELKKWNLPLVCTGTRWDTKDFPSWAIDGYSPNLSLGGLFWLIKNRAAIVVSPNSGIGFAAHWLGTPTLMIDNRTGWKEMIKVWKQQYPRLKDEALPGEFRWPMFMKENFYPQHLLRIPFEQIEWNSDAFLAAMQRIRSGVVNIPPPRQRQRTVQVDREPVVQREPISVPVQRVTHTPGAKERIQQLERWLQEVHSRV